MLTAAKPDPYYGARPEQLDRRVRDELSGHIIPSTQDDLPIAPNFFLEVKGPDGSAAVARRQACHNGALGARGMHSLQSYEEEEPVDDNNASTITSIYYERERLGEGAERRGVRRANEKANESQVGTLAVDASSVEASLDEASQMEALSQESESSSDELALDYKVPAKRSRRHSNGSQQPRRKSTRQL